MTGLAGLLLTSSTGAKSTLSPIASLRVPGRIPAGQRTRNGIRSDSSYISRLSNQPWSPRKNPWSLV